MPSNSKNTAIIAAAGSGKTECLVEKALAVEDGNVLITTYTDENQRHIINRIEQKVGFVPKHITVMGWFTFLITQCIKPYQQALTNTPFLIRGLNFRGEGNRFTKKVKLEYFIDSNGDLYRDRVSDLAFQVDLKTNGVVIKRLEAIYTHLLIDEVQDMVGYDLDVLDLLLDSRINIIAVGDPRQHTYETNRGPKGKKYHGSGLTRWFSERKSKCSIVTLDVSYRCNQVICDFADAIFPELPKTKSREVRCTGHDGIFIVCESQLQNYLCEHSPVALRYDKRTDTFGFQAFNIGVLKGSEFDRVVVFPTKKWLTYLKDKDVSKLTSKEKLYVAVTRARFSVAFVVPDDRHEEPFQKLADITPGVALKEDPTNNDQLALILT